MIIARRFFVSGRVQGVFFRSFSQEVATREGLAGSVRNLPDGRVEAYAEGSAEAVEAFGKALRTGPPESRVDDVVARDEKPSGTKRFRVTD